MEQGDLVVPVRGRDKGRMMLIAGKTDSRYLLLCDGRLRKIESPKRKLEKHVEWLSSAEGTVPDKLRKHEKVTNAELRRCIAGFRMSEGGGSYGQG